MRLLIFLFLVNCCFINQIWTQQVGIQLPGDNFNFGIYDESNLFQRDSDKKDSDKKDNNKKDNDKKDNNKKDTDKDNDKKDNNKKDTDKDNDKKTSIKISSLTNAATLSDNILSSTMISSDDKKHQNKDDDKDNHNDDMDDDDDKKSRTKTHKHSSKTHNSQSYQAEMTQTPINPSSIPDQTIFSPKDQPTFSPKESIYHSIQWDRQSCQQINGTTCQLLIESKFFSGNHQPNLNQGYQTYFVDRCVEKLKNNDLRGWKCQQILTTCDSERYPVIKALINAFNDDSDSDDIQKRHHVCDVSSSFYDSNICSQLQKISNSSSTNPKHSTLDVIQWDLAFNQPMLSAKLGSR